MADATLIVLLLSVMSLGVIVMAITLVMIAGALRRTLRELNVFLPECRQAVQEAHQVLRTAHQFIGRTDHAAHRFTEIVLKAADVVGAVVEQMGTLKHRTEAFLAERFGFGNGVKSRRLRPSRRRLGT